ncbi:ATP-binding protein [Salinispora fenicalii]|uniref:ATP-binding protein n=1 Tax=Salinispora fenicalii TaxID=1137263 RepID=UPI0016600358|nr:AAA family ATPase [Salinispora fenicalii]
MADAAATSPIGRTTYRWTPRGGHVPHHRTILHGREDALRIIDEFLTDVGSGTGRAIAFEGNAGVGKSATLRKLREDAQHKGLQILRARGTELECDFPWGVARQLLEFCSDITAPDQRFAVLRGPAELASELLSQKVPEAPRTLELHPTVHGLYWVCRNLSRRRPLVIVVDDAHFADIESLNMLAYIANRLEDGSIGLAFTTGPLDVIHRGELVAAVATGPSARLARLGTLDVDAIGALIMEHFEGVHTEPEFVEACYALCQGNPRFVKEILAEAVTAGIKPTAEDVGNLYDVAPRRITVHVLHRLNRLGPLVRRAAQAVAVLGPDADARRCASVAEMNTSTFTGAARTLIDEQILHAALPFAFSHPVIQSVVYDSLTPKQRHTAHHLAARALSGTGGSLATVGAHLLRTLPGADRWVVDMLAASAADATCRGLPRQAAALLRRGLAEPPNDTVAARVLVDLAAAELCSGDSAALSHLYEALQHPADEDLHHRARLLLAGAHLAQGRYDACRRIVHQGLQRGQSAQHTVFQRLREFSAALDDLTPRPSAGDAPEPTPPRRGPALRALRGLGSGMNAARVRVLAELSLRPTKPQTGLDHPLPEVCLAAWTLCQAGQPLRADAVLRGPAGQARAAGCLLTAQAATAVSALAALDLGELATAETLASRVLADFSHDTLVTPAVWLAASTAVQVLIELDCPARAQTVLDSLLRAGGPPDAAFCDQLAVARAALKISQGKVQAGTSELLKVRKAAIDRCWHHPGLTAQYIVPLTEGLIATSRERQADLVTAEELLRARRFGAPRPIAAALRARSRVLPPHQAMTDLQHAHDLMATTPYRLDQAKIEVDTGTLLRRTGRRTEGRERLLHGLVGAERCEATALIETARSELRLAGARAATATTAQVLTPAEQRVVAKASEGLTNREIAKTLFVTVKTVEWHLGQAFRKLGIRRRSELAQALPDVPVGSDKKAG